MEAVVANPVEPVPCNSRALLAKLAVPDKEPVTVSWPWIVVLPVTVRDPDMYGELSIILLYYSYYKIIDFNSVFILMIKSLE